MCFPPDVEGVSERFVAGVMTVSKRKTQIFVNICELVNLLNKSGKFSNHCSFGACHRTTTISILIHVIINKFKSQSKLSLHLCYVLYFPSTRNCSSFDEHRLDRLDFHQSSYSCNDFNICL